MTDPKTLLDLLNSGLPTQHISHMTGGFTCEIHSVRLLPLASMPGRVSVCSRCGLILRYYAPDDWVCGPKKPERNLGNEGF